MNIQALKYFRKRFEIKHVTNKFPKTTCVFDHERKEGFEHHDIRELVLRLIYKTQGAWSGLDREKLLIKRDRRLQYYRLKKEAA